MRPLEITLEGFKSYRKPQTFSFESRSLFGIVGPTGSGKSTILEALIFALYGKTPRVERDTKKLINSQEEQARVQLVFEADNVVWEVIRIIRRKGPSQTVLRKLSESSSDPVSGERSTNERVTEIVGLDFSAFCSSVSLPQGEFDRFLKATPAERSRILKGIFRLERVDLLREAARATWSSIDGQMLVLKASLEVLPDEPEVLLESLRTDAAQASITLGEIRDALPKVLEAEQELRRSADDLRRLKNERDQTETVLGRLPREEWLRDLSDRQEQAEQRVKTANQALLEAVEALNKAEAREASTEIETGGEAWLLQVGNLLSNQRRLTDSVEADRAEEEHLGERVIALGVSRERAEAALGATEATRTGARAELNELRQLHAAHFLRGELVEGHPCPVCEHKVVKVPLTEHLPAASDAEQRLSTAERAWTQARAKLDSAQREQAGAEEGLRFARARLARSEAELQAVTSELVDQAGKDAKGELARRQALLADARREAQAARAQREVADGAERQARLELDRMSEDIRGVVNLLTHTCGLLGISSVSVEAQGLWDSSKQVSEQGAQRLEDLEKKISVLQDNAKSNRLLLDDFRTRFGADSQDQASDLLARAKAEVLRLGRAIEEVEAGIAKRLLTEAEIQRLSARKALFDRLITDFSDAKFTAFLLDEQRRLLSRIGSEKFLELTGHYSFDDEGQFQIIDQRTGTTRSPDTLSGGETFLASLSLALALAEAVALEGGRLGCFFLDEGFGSLDQESLDLALEGIEALAVPGRLIGLISHVGGIQARLDDLIVLERMSDGSTEVAQHEGPIGYAPALI